MFDFLMQVLALLVLLAAVWWGYRRWIQPRGASLDLQGLGLLGLITLTLMGGALGSIPWWLDDARSFSWDLPPLASRMLASAGVAFATVTFMALERPNRRRLRLVLLLLATYLAPLVAAILLFHLDRFDPAAPITYGFFVIAGGMTIGALWYLLRQPDIPNQAPADPTPPTPTVRWWLSAVAVLTGLWGLALFLTDAGPLAAVWVWPGDLLTSRLIAVMLLTIAAGAMTSRGLAELARMILAMIVVYGLGVVLTNLSLWLVGKPVRPAYLLVFGVLFAGSALLLFVERQQSERAAVAA
ncbi:MAG TPA: hypothetical protein VER55_10040 [Ardenticatenaceae bacterium]|nr:hypothetical protein [Ardenticatenaceae bacterium]